MAYTQLPTKNGSSNSFDTNFDEIEKDKDYFGDNSKYNYDHKISINSGAYEPLNKLGNFRKNQHQKSVLKKVINMIIYISAFTIE